MWSRRASQVSRQGFLCIARFASKIGHYADHISFRNSRSAHYAPHPPGGVARSGPNVNSGMICDRRNDRSLRQSAQCTKILAAKPVKRGVTTSKNELFFLGFFLRLALGFV